MGNIKKYSLDEIEKMESKSDKKKFDGTTEKEVLEQIIADPDASRLTQGELKELKLVTERKK